jgi:hypothetical protein
MILDKRSMLSAFAKKVCAKPIKMKQIRKTQLNINSTFKFNRPTLKKCWKPLSHKMEFVDHARSGALLAKGMRAKEKPPSRSLRCKSYNTLPYETISRRANETEPYPSIGYGSHSLVKFPEQVHLILESRIVQRHPHAAVFRLRTDAVLIVVRRRVQNRLYGGAASARFCRATLASGTRCVRNDGVARWRNCSLRQFKTSWRAEMCGRPPARWLSPVRALFSNISVLSLFHFGHLSINILTMEWKTSVRSIILTILCCDKMTFLYPTWRKGKKR